MYNSYILIKGGFIMSDTLIKNLYRNTDDYLGKDVQVSGWVRTVRDSKSFGFIELNDGSFYNNLQIVFDNKLDNFSDICKLTISSSIIVTGTIVKTENAKQPFEMHAKKVEIYNLCDSDYPLQKKRHSFEYLRTISHLRPRTNTFNAVFRVRSLLSFAIHKFFQERGFVYVHTPLITASDAEGAGEMFAVSTFDFENVPKTDDGMVDYSKDFSEMQHFLQRNFFAVFIIIFLKLLTRMIFFIIICNQLQQTSCIENTFFYCYIFINNFNVFSCSAVPG